MRSLVDDLRSRSPFFRRILQKPIVQDLAELALPSVVLGQLLYPLHQNLGNLVREIEHFVGRHLQVARRFDTPRRPQLSAVRQGRR